MEALRCYSLLVWWFYTCLLPVADAKVCAAYNKVSYEDWSRWNSEAIDIPVRYKIKRYTWYCLFNQDCCFGSCCYKESDDGMNSDSSKSTPYAAVVGIVIGVAFGIFLCIVCWVNFCKSQRNTNSSTGVTYADNDTVVMRQIPQGETESPLLPPCSDHESDLEYPLSRVDSDSTAEHNVYPNQGIPEMNSSLDGHSTHTTELSEPPPSYEYVMSHGFPIITSENSKTD